MRDSRGSSHRLGAMLEPHFRVVTQLMMGVSAYGAARIQMLDDNGNFIASDERQGGILHRRLCRGHNLKQQSWHFLLMPLSKTA